MGMKKNLIIWFFGLVVSFPGSSLGAGEGSVDFDRSGAGSPGIIGSAFSSAADIPAAPAPVLAGNVTYADGVKSYPLAPKEWTVILYLNGKSNLEIDGFRTINVLERLGSDRNINIVVEYGRMRGQPADSTVDGDWTGARRYLIVKDNNTRKINSPVLMKLNKVDQGDYRHAIRFITWAKKNFPARRYMLIFWSHASGWVYPEKPEITAMGISFDDETDNYITTPQMGRIFQAVGGIDLYISDACMMQGLEFAYEIKDYTKIIMGSELYSYDLEYYEFMRLLLQNPGSTPEQLATYILKTYWTYYEDTSMKIQLSAVRSAALAGLVEGLNKWTGLVQTVDDTAAVKTARKNVNRFDKYYYADLYTFIEIFNNNLSSQHPRAGELHALGQELLKYISRTVVYRNVSTGEKLSRARGLSVHMPAGGNKPWDFKQQYSRLRVNRDLRWYDFMIYVDSVK